MAHPTNERILSFFENPSCTTSYRLPKPRPDGLTVLHLTPLEFLDLFVALAPPPRKHRHRYHGVLASNAASPPRSSSSIRMSTGKPRAAFILRADSLFQWRYYSGGNIANC
ncbi:MAG: transposase [Methylococcales bacterium]